MNILIKETSEVKSLNLTKNGVDFVLDFINLDDFEFSNDCYITDSETFDFWKTLVDVKQKSEDLKAEYAHLINDEVLTEIHESSHTDFCDAVYIELSILERIIKEKN